MSITLTHAMVLAAGFGKRLRPMTDHMPKPLVPVNGQPLIDYALNALVDYGIEEVVVNSAYKAPMLHEHLKQRMSPHITLSPEAEDSPLETGGGIAKALPYLSATPFLSMNSDTILADAPRSIARMVESWHDELDVLMCLHPLERAYGYDGMGDFVMREDGALRRRHAEERAPYVFTGTQIVHPRLFDHVPEGAFSLNVLYNRLLGADGYFNRIAAIIHEGDWLHVGDANGLKQANHFFLKANV